jgi:DNA processing protein
MTEEQRDILALYGVPGVGAKTFARLSARFGSAGAVFDAPDRDVLSVEGVGPVLLGNIRGFDRAAFLRVQEQLMEKYDAIPVTRRDPEYPPRLDAFPSAPPVLFVRGDVSALSLPSLALVGTRRPTSWGRTMTAKLTAGAVHAGFCVVSGMAAGIDTASHRAALDESGKTVAVFGCGVDVIYPVENQRLSEEIRRSGCLVSHFPMGTKGSPGNFPARNALVVGLTQGTIVVEAPRKSGALITANLTLRARHPLFAVPGNADSPSSEGANSLLGSGAIPISRFEQVLSALGSHVPPTPRGGVEPRPIAEKRPLPPGLGGDILQTLESEPLQVEALCTKLGAPIHIILPELTMLEMDGFIRQKPGKVFERM